VSRRRDAIGYLRIPARALRRALEVLLVERHYVLPAGRMAAVPVPPGEHHKAYAPTPWRLLRHLLPPEEVDERDVFLDVGCGKGRVMLEAGETYRFSRIIGVEAIPELADAASALLTSNEHRLRGCSWDVVRADAAKYDVPDDVTVAYLFDPFTGPAFQAALAQLEASVDRRPRLVRLIYLAPTEIDSLLRLERVVPLRQGVTGWLTTGGRYKYFVGDLMPAQRLAEG
jgi:SAM-dependent methyltransferase